MCAQGLDAKSTGRAGADDVNNVFQSFGGDPKKDDSTIDKAAMQKVRARPPSARQANARQAKRACAALPFFAPRSRW